MATGYRRPHRRFSPLDIIRDAAAVWVILTAWVMKWIDGMGRGERKSNAVSLPAPVLSAQHASLDTVIAVILTVAALVLCERSPQRNYCIANEYGYLRDQIVGVIGTVHLNEQRIGCGSHDGLIDAVAVCGPRNPVLDKLKFIAVLGRDVD
jgi:hypothetical protein